MKINNGIIRAYSRTTDQLVALWPITLDKNEFGRFSISVPIIGKAFTETKLFPSSTEAARFLNDGNEWMRIEVEWLR